MPPPSATPGQAVNGNLRIMRRLLELLRHPQELALLIFRVFRIARDQGLRGLRQGLRRELRHLNQNPLPISAYQHNYLKWLQNLPISPPPAPCPHIFITIVIPLNSWPAPGLERTLAAIRRQTHREWEAVLAVPTSITDAPADLGQSGVRNDPRFSVLKQDLTPPALCNEILAHRQGTHLCLVGADDELDRQALAKLARAAHEHPQALLIYCDEDQLDDQGVRHSPYFKPDWDPLLCWGQNYPGRLTLFNRETIKAHGGFAPGLPYAYEWDLVLRLTFGQSADRIPHVPEILYHRHRHPDEHEFARRQEEQTMLNARLRAVGQAGCQLTSLPEGWRVIFPLPAPPPLVSIIIPTRNGQQLLSRCIKSLTRTDYPAFEVIVVDNQSDDGPTLEYLDQLAKSGAARIIRHNEVFNYSEINNLAARQAQGDILCFLNNDTEVIAPAWLTDLVRQAARAEIGAAGAMLYYADDTIQHAGVALGLGPNGPAGIAGHAFQGLKRGVNGQNGRLRFDQHMAAVTGACLVVRRKVFEEVNGFDAVHLPVTLNDVDLCLKIQRAGYHNVLVPSAKLYHHESVSRGQDDAIYSKRLRCSREMLYMRKAWGELLDHDPHFPSGELGMNDWG